jgi:hypothetical protein
MMNAAIFLTMMAATSSPAATVTLYAYDEQGQMLDLPAVIARLSRADDKNPDPDKLPFWAFPNESKAVPTRVKLSKKEKLITASWPSAGPARLELIWPVKEDGYSGVIMDNEGSGFPDGATIALDEEIAKTQYRRFMDSWKKHTTDWQPLYAPGNKAKDLAEDAKQAMADAARQTMPDKRAVGFQKALHAVALAWEKFLYEHGLQIARHEKYGKKSRFGLTLDDSLIKRIDDFEWIAQSVQRSGSDWVRVVMRPNAADFTYAEHRSFHEYDAIIDELRKRNLKIMITILDTAQWPRTMTPPTYAERVKNIVLHYKGRASSWEVGSELNGDWIGGASNPMSPDQVYRIFSAGAAQAKKLDPTTETVATLYWWEQTAPDRAHSLSGWLNRFSNEGFGKSVDVVGLELFPEDNPVGFSFERIFDETSEAIPGTTLMLSSFGYVEKDTVSGYWWLSPEDIDGGRKDLLILYTGASCAMRYSVCGGFWWQTLDQMLPIGNHRATDLYKIHSRTMSQLGRKP